MQRTRAQFSLQPLDVYRRSLFHGLREHLQRTDFLAASSAADIWATTNILIPAFEANGYSEPWPEPNPAPDDPNSMFRTYLDRSMEKLIDAGYAVTNDLESIDTYSATAAIRRPAPRRPSGRVMPQRSAGEQVIPR